MEVIPEFEEGDDATIIGNLARDRISAAKRNTMLRRRASSSSSKLLENRHCRQWNTLFCSLIDLNERTYTKNGKDVIMRLQSIIQHDVVNSSKTATIGVLYLIYERALQEILLKTFPVSGSLINTLTENLSDDIFNKVQPLIQEHMQSLKTKLQENSPIDGTDVGVVCLLVSIFRIEKMAHQDSQICSVLKQFIEDTTDYLELVSLEKNFSNDALIVLIFALIWFTQADDSREYDVKKLKTFARKGHIKYHKTMTIFGRTLLMNTIENMQNFDYNYKLYATSYKKVMAAQKFLLTGIGQYLTETSFPNDGSGSDSDLSHDQELTNKLSLLKTQDSIEADDVFNDSPAAESVSSIARLEPEGSSGSDEEQKQETPKTPTRPIYQPPALKRQTSSTSSDEGDSQKWARRLSQEVKIEKSPIKEEKIVEDVINIPERYIGRVIGHEGAIARRLELKSNASIVIGKKAAPARPTTTCLTAHRLVTGALGVRPQMATDQVSEEKKKLADAKVKRNTGEKEILTREIILNGTKEQKEKAKDLINEIINNIVTISVPVKLTVESLLQRFGNKIKTIEAVLNVYIEIEELEDLTVTIDISGDRKSCSDAKKSILEDLCQFETFPGQMFYIPNAIQSVLKTEVEMLMLFGTIKDVCNVKINKFGAPNGQAVFISGRFEKVTEAVNIFQATNYELTYALLQEDNTITADDLIGFIQEKFGRKREVRRKYSKSPTLIRKGDCEDEAIVISDGEEEEKQPRKRISYSREQLITIGKTCLEFPQDRLEDFMRKDSDADQVIVLEGNKERLEKVITDLKQNQWGTPFTNLKMK
uniref:K Homology domain-containing protein n=1 Tax=Clytia hemisphaerica TaxID=252671 RepID=A0A7M5VCB9_9CNID